MLVYGDAVRREKPEALLGSIRIRLERARDAEPGILRHQELVGALIEAGELAQGLADVAFESRGHRDGPSPPDDDAMELALALADCVGRSWCSEFRDGPDLPWAALERAHQADLPSRILIKLPEGFAHYCLYPEAYWEAARHALGGHVVRVIGLRSIGTTLAAMVAAAVGAAAPITLRPVGHPFERKLSLSAAGADALASKPEIERAIVDEGPGLSGSSMASVAAHLRSAGVADSRIHLFPGHAHGPGAQANDAVRALWSTLPMHVATFDELALGARDGAHNLEHWVSDLVGVPLAPLLEISGGGWRHQQDRSEADWPPVAAGGEKRKFLLQTETGTWLLKFAGLGRIGELKAERGRHLHEAGFVPAVAGFRHGFLVERWRGDARPLDAGDRPALLRRVAEYLAFRRREFPAEPGRGASTAELFGMARANAAEALGETTAQALETCLPDPETLARYVSPIETDNRLHAWEWLVTSDGILKTDALDHHVAHDLVGAQDVAWDIAGAVTEFSLSRGERDELCAAVERLSGLSVASELLGALLPCYRAFQLGCYTMAVSSTGDEAERARLRSMAQRYGRALVDDLSRGA